MCSGLNPEFNLWTAIAPYANQLVSDESGSPFQTFLEEALKIGQLLIGLPGRTDRVLTLVERGDLSVQTPLLNIRVRRLERSVGRVTGALVFSALLIAGAILYSAVPVYAKWLMAASAVPLAVGVVLWTRAPAARVVG